MSNAAHGPVDLAAKVLVVTGAGGALGGAVAARAELCGAQVWRLDLGFTAGESARERRVAVDLADLAATRAALARVGRIDALCNVAGGFAMGPAVHALSDEDWDAMFRINVLTLRNAVRAVVPGMLAVGRGAIVNVGAAGALHGGPNVAAYAAAKSTVMRLTESMSQELRAQGINVIAVLPGTLDTPRNRADMPDADPSRWVAPQDLADVICFLCSDAARAVHGALVPVVGLS
jgi:NAD(P)-dependent dehydrogenase (short-subunit alcohol dehydrogenase family)